MNEELSPEEKLLNLIKGQSKISADSERRNSPSLPSAKETPDTSKIKKPLFNILEKRKKLGTVLRRRRFAFKKPGFKFIHKALLTFCLLLLSYLIFTQIIDRLKSPDAIPVPKVVRKQENKEKLLSTSRPYTYYSQEIGKRDIFKPYEKAKPKIFSGLPKPQKVTLQEQAANFTLIGIILDQQKSQAVIVDNNKKKTYFLNTGQSIGEIKVEKILKGKVILSYEGEQLDLRL